MKILFINPAVRSDSLHRFMPVGLGYVVTCMEEAGYNFDILDIDITRISDQQLVKYLSRNKYDMIAFGAIVTHYHWIKWLVQTVKELQPHCTVVVGNSVAESAPEVLFANSPVDIIVQAEGEITMVELVDALVEGRVLGEVTEPVTPTPHFNGDYPPRYRGTGVPGIVFRDKQGRLVDTGHRKAVRKIDELPYPNWDLFDVEEYLKHGVSSVVGNVTKYGKDEAKVMPVNTARGCVFKCTFCHYTQWNDPYRHRSSESVIGEINRNMEKYGANYINLWDDLSFHKLGPAEKFLDEFLAADLDIHWTAAIRSDLFGRAEIPREDRMRVATKFRDAGATVLAFSLESANEEILKTMNKRVEASYFKEQVGILREVGDIVIATSVVIGYPQETPETIAETMQMCRSLGIYPSPGFLLPLPATEMWKYCVDNGFITDPDRYLTELTERQDIVLNITKMSDEALMNEVTTWLHHISEDLKLGYEGDRLMRTGGIQDHAEGQVRNLKPHALKPQMNYAQMEGGI